MGYSYYDTPDGEDCFKKMWYTSKIAGVTGLTIAAFDTRLYSHPQGFFPTAARFAYFTFPMMGMAAAFTAATCIATNVRQKDDALNYFIGGCAAGAVAGTWRKSGVFGVVTSVLFGVAGAIKKTAVMEGWILIPENSPRMYGGVFGSRQDYSLARSPPKTWTP